MPDEQVGLATRGRVATAACQQQEQQQDSLTSRGEQPPAVWAKYAGTLAGLGTVRGAALRSKAERLSVCRHH
jgi:hypothetical protein